MVIVIKIGFRGLHPATAFLYYILVFTFTLSATHPLLLAGAVLCGLLYDIKYREKKALVFAGKVVLPLSLIACIFNGLVNYRGETVIFMLPWDKPFTLEAVLYGAMFSLRIAATLIWLHPFNETVTEDKILFLFGKISPRTALIISMALRFIPLISSQSDEIIRAEKGVGRGIAAPDIRRKIKSTVRRLSILVTWTLERGIDTADSMSARGYGLKNRTVYSRFVFTLRDLFFIALWAVFTVLTILFFNSLKTEYLPSVSIPFPDIYSAFYMVFSVIFLLIPLIYDISEEKKWSISA